MDGWIVRMREKKDRMTCGPFSPRDPSEKIMPPASGCPVVGVGIPALPIGDDDEWTLKSALRNLRGYAEDVGQVAEFKRAAYAELLQQKFEDATREMSPPVPALDVFVWGDVLVFDELVTA